MKFLFELAGHRDLLYMLTWKEIKIKYKQSIMGLFWAILMPAIIVSAGILVKLAMARLSGQPIGLTDITTIMIKALPWSFFVASLRFGANSLISNTNLVTKISFPKELFPISAVLSQLFDFLIASCVVITIMTFLQVGTSLHLLWALVLLLVLVILSMTLAILLSALNLFFRDVKYIVEVFVTFAIFFTPVFYDVSLAGKWQWVLLLNPVAPILEGLKASIILHQTPEIDWFLYSGVVSVVGLLAAMKLFKKMEPKFAESI